MLSTTPLLIVLDLDETLIYGVEEALNDRKPDFKVGSFFIYKRPNLDVFLDALLNEFQVAVWTSASPDYAAGIVKNLFASRRSELKFTWDSLRCSRKYDPEWQNHFYIKNLAKVKRNGWPLERIIAVDDTPQKYAQHYGNLVTVKPWLGDENDEWLLQLLAYLRILNDKPNVRRVEKRGWNAG